MGTTDRDRLFRCAALLAMALLIAGCAVFDGEKAGETAEAETPEEGEEEHTAGDDDGDAGDAGGSAPLPEDVDLDISKSHPNGAVIQLQQVRFTANTIELEVEILNGRDGPIQLNGGLNSRRLHVGDDVGNEYPFSPPTDNEAVEVAEGESLEGTLVFLGRVDREATELTVHSYGGADNQSPGFPGVDMDIVIPLEQG